ncbi:double-strand break repair protein mre11 [Fusarium langsethiae]|uniref:Double-strand break repair protein mre11 n=1 Tax=Fusarium langsethiae TaxID=179993 RepID=A0A0N0DAC4_FUSLA|nr:double-strand break repair protein mre11 [Fusarium langsethiae]GKU18514.1 unnamed protein product [Fusarium langsethiae]
MIEEANADWEAIQTDEEALEERPLPLIRLKVEYTAQDGGQFEIENPQRFSNRFVGKVANTNDVVYFYRKKTASRKANATNPTEALEALEGGDDMVKVENLVQDFLSAQSLKVLPQGPFGDAVTQFVTKDDKHAMELFVSEHLTGQVRSMLGLESDDEDLNSAMEIYRTRIEQQQARGLPTAPTKRKRVLKPKPPTWDSDFDGAWEEEADAWTYEDDQQAENTHAPAPAKKAARGKSKAAQEDEDLMDEDEPPAKKPAAKRAARTTKAKAAPAKKAPPKGRGRKAFEDSEEEEEEDVVMESEDEPAPPPPKTRRAAATKSNAKTTAAKPAAKSTRQTKLNFSQSQKSGTQSKAVEISDDEISDDDAFEPAPAPAPRTRRR